MWNKEDNAFLASYLKDKTTYGKITLAHSFMIKDCINANIMKTKFFKI